MHQNPPMLPARTPTLRLRRARIEDAKAIAGLCPNEADLAQAAPRASYPLRPSDVEEWLDARDAGHVLENDGEVLAFAELLPGDSPTVRWVAHMMVHPDHRKRGLGKMLLEQLILHSTRRLGAHRLRLSVFANNQPARRCYRAANFVSIGGEKRGANALLHLEWNANRRSERAIARPTLAALAVGALGLSATAFPADVNQWLLALPQESLLLPLLLTCITVAGVALLLQPLLPRPLESPDRLAFQTLIFGPLWALFSAIIMMSILVGMGAPRPQPDQLLMAAIWAVAYGLLWGGLLAGCLLLLRQAAWRPMSSTTREFRQS